jgi:hypothetical protein
LHGGITVATVKERMAAYRQRRLKREVRLTSTVHEDDLVVIAREGHVGAATIDVKAREQAVATFVADCCEIH